MIFQFIMKTRKSINKVLIRKLIMLIGFILCFSAKVAAQYGSFESKNLNVRIYFFDDQGKEISLHKYKNRHSKSINNSNNNKSKYIVYHHKLYNGLSSGLCDDPLIYKNSILYNFGTIHNHNENIKLSIIRYDKNSIDTMIIVISNLFYSSSERNILCKLRFNSGISYIETFSPYVRSKMRISEKTDIDISPDNWCDYEIKDDPVSFYDNANENTNSSKKRPYGYSSQISYFIKLLNEDGKEIQLSCIDTELCTIYKDIPYPYGLDSRFGDYLRKNLIKHNLTIENYRKFISEDSSYIVTINPLGSVNYSIAGILKDTSKKLTFMFCDRVTAKSCMIRIKHFINDGYEEMILIGNSLGNIPFIPGNYFVTGNKRFTKFLQDYYFDKKDKSLILYREVFKRAFKL